MNTTALNRIKNLKDGKVVRIFKDNNFYKISKMDSMAAIVMRPDPKRNDTYYTENITLTGHCSLYEAEQLIEQLSE